MPLTGPEELKLQEAFQAIEKERADSLRAMFAGTQLVSRSKLADAKQLEAAAKDAAKKLKAVPGVDVPTLGVPHLNIHLFDGIDLRALVHWTMPSIPSLSVDLAWVPHISLGSIPGFSLPKIRLNLKGILKFKDLLPDISLRALACAIALKLPHISFPSLMLDLSRILDIDFDVLFPSFRLGFPEFFIPNYSLTLPDLSIPDLSIPGIRLEVPTIDLRDIRINVPDVNIDIPSLLRIPGFDKVLKLLFETFDALDINVIIGELGVAFLSDFFSSALPIVQQVKSGAQAAASWGTAAQDWHKAHHVQHRLPFILPGNAREACQAVARLLITSRNEHAALATIQTTQFAASTAGLFVDLGGVTGPAVAATAALAKTCQTVMIMGARYREMKKVNEILKNSPGETLSANIFAVSPLLGCYYLANNTTSNVLNILSKNLLEDNWMADWERNKREHLDPLIRESQRFIGESRYVLDPLRQNKGMYVELSFSEKLKNGAILYVKKKLGKAPSTATAPTHRYIGR